MNILILNGKQDPAADARYRGTFRAHPTYCNHLSRDHEVNELFFWFLREGGETGVVHDLAKASRYAQLLNEVCMVGFERFEVVEVAHGFDPKGQGELLGYDISSGYNDSLLWWGLQPQPGINVLPGPIRELADLLHRHYAPLLGQYGLFKSAETADQCLRSMDALQRLSPNLVRALLQFQAWPIP